MSRPRLSRTWPFSSSSATAHTLRRSSGQIHIAFDGARTRIRHALYGVTAVFRDEDNQLRKLVLGIPELGERHSGENIAAEILDIIRSFGIEDKVGYFTLDNAANNETAMREIAQELHFDPVQRRVRCVGHILNLVVKSLLFGKDADAFEDTFVKGEALARAAHDTWDATWDSAGVKGTRLQHCHDVQFYDGAFAQLLTDERLTGATASLIKSPNVQLHHTKAFIKPPEKGSPFPLHQDAPFFPHERQSMIAAIIPLTTPTRRRDV